MIALADIRHIAAYYAVSAGIGAAATVFIASLWFRPYQTATFLLILAVALWLLYAVSKVSVVNILRGAGVLMSYISLRRETERRRVKDSAADRRRTPRAGA